MDERLEALTEAELLRRYHLDGDRRAREELIARLLPLARRLANGYVRSGCSGDDLFQVASLGLVKAIDRFDVRRGTELSRFAVAAMVEELKRHVRGGQPRRSGRMSGAEAASTLPGSRRPPPQLQAS